MSVPDRMFLAVAEQCAITISVSENSVLISQTCDGEQDRILVEGLINLDQLSTALWEARKLLTGGAA